MPGWLWTTTTWRKLNCTHRQTGAGNAAWGKTNEPTACRLLPYLTPNCRLQIRPPTVVSPEKLNVAAAPLSNCQIPLAMRTYVPIGWSHSAFSLQDLLHSLRLFPKWAIVEVGTILQQCLAWRPIGQLPTHHLFLGHCCTHRPAAQLMPEKSRRIHFCISKLTENPAAAVFTAETMLFFSR